MASLRDHIKSVDHLNEVWWPTPAAAPLTGTAWHDTPADRILSDPRPADTASRPPDQRVND